MRSALARLAFGTRPSFSMPACCASPTSVPTVSNSAGKNRVKLSVASVRAVAETPVFTLRSVILALGITRPDGSRTVPSTAAVSNWARQQRQQPVTRSKARRKLARMAVWYALTAEIATATERG